MLVDNEVIRVVNNAVFYLRNLNNLSSQKH